MTAPHTSKVKIASLAPGQAFRTLLTARRGRVTAVAEFSEAVYASFEDGETKGVHRNVLVEETAH